MSAEKDWLELSLEAHSAEEVERFEEALLAAGAVAISYSAADEEEIYEPPLGTMPLWARTGVTGLFIGIRMCRDIKPRPRRTTRHHAAHRRPQFCRQPVDPGLARPLPAYPLRRWPAPAHRRR